MIPRTSLASGEHTWVHKGVRVSSYAAEPRRLEWELVVPAEVDAVWAAWVEAEVLATWGGPGAAVDLRPGGVWHVYFYPDAPPGERGGDANFVTSYVPARELRLRAGAPQEFPTVRSEKTDLSVRLDPVGFGHVRVHVMQTDWKQGPEWDRAFATMAHANAEWLSWLHQRFTVGPMDWNRLALQFPAGSGSAPLEEAFDGTDSLADGGPPGPDLHGSA